MKPFFVNMPDGPENETPEPFEHHVLCALSLELPASWRAEVAGRVLRVTEPITGRSAELMLRAKGKG